MRVTDYDSSSSSPADQAASTAAPTLPRRSERGRQQKAQPSRTATQAANKDLHALQALTDIALSHLALDDLLTALLERISDVLSVDNGAVLLLDPTGQTLTVQAVLGLVEPGPTPVQVSIGQGFAGRIAATREPLVVDDITTFPVADPGLRDQLHSLAGVPLVVGTQLVGVIHVGSVLPRHFSEYEVHLLQQVADRIALAIDRARLYRAEQQARKMAEAALAKAEQQAAQLAATFEAIADGVVVFNAEGRLERENAAHQRLLGIDTAMPHFAELPLPERLALFAARDVRGRPMGVEEGPLPRALRGEVLSGAETMDMLSRTLDGREVELSVSAAPIRDRDGHVTGAVGIFRDQTEQKRLEREREQARAHELALEDTARHMDEFLATASHDLRTPLTVVKSRVQMAIRRLERLRGSAATFSHAPLDAELGALHASLLEANQSADRLTRFGGLLFDVARARSGRLDLQLVPCDLAALVTRSAAAQRVAAPGRRIVLEVPAEPVLVKADADRLDQVVGNYLTNALKYSPADRPVTVRLEVVEGVATVNVADQGPGLAQEELSRIWDLFHRAPGIAVQSGSSEISGSMGLGLHICKQLIELHPGGSVGVESVLGEGATFWFQLPLAS